jgi:glycine/D-amino acid oxidase-like deaminating enzyme
VYEEEIDEILTIVKTYLGIDATLKSTAVCMYTNTPDEDFIIDYHPDHRNIIIASPCSGHGFKFSSAIGKLLCEMALEQSLNFDISVFKIKRLWT